MEKCVHPNCDYVADNIITNNHCMKEHGLSKKEIENKYGKITQASWDFFKLNENMKYNNENSRFYGSK